MNVPTRVGFQSPFSNITLDLVCPLYLKSEAVIIGGILQDKSYGEFQKEMDMINKAFFEVMLRGDAQGRIFSFPIPTINITKGFDWDNPQLTPLWEITAKYGPAYFSNFINPDMNPEDARSLCCRLKLDNKELRRRGGGLFGSNPQTGSIGVCTLNLPLIAYEANGSMDKFLTGIAKYMDVAKLALEAKRKVIEEYTENGLYPYTKFYLENVKRRFNKYWANHFSTIGIIGAYEASTMLGIDYTTMEGAKFSARILEFMRTRIYHIQETTGNMYNLEATPAEGASHKLALKAKALYPKIMVSGDTHPYFTNSTMLPAQYSTDLFKVLEHQDISLPLYTGGSVFHTYIGEKISGEQAKQLVKKILSKYKLPYISITPTFSVCPTHGYTQGEHPICPKCLEEKTSLEERIRVLKEKLK
jgi:ribonucleoside-triphosphate reductase